LPTIRDANVRGLRGVVETGPPRAEPARDDLPPCTGQQLERLAAELLVAGVGAVMKHPGGRAKPRLDALIGGAQREVEVLVVEKDLLVERAQPAERVGPRDERASTAQPTGRA